MKITFLTLFPKQIESHLKHGIFRIAAEKDLTEFEVLDIRKFTDDNHGTVDDKPFGGGAGMVMKIEPIYKALQQVRTDKSIVLMTTPRGRKLDQKFSRELASIETQGESKVQKDHLIILMGHYEGIDNRVAENYVDIEFSIGDYILSGGELAGLVLADSVVRLIDGVLGNIESAQDESFESEVLEYPHYTRPSEFMGLKVPEVLLSGHHGEVEKWRNEQALKDTRQRRPDLIK